MPDGLSPGLLFAQFHRLDTALWIFDFDALRVIWANRAALEVWDADSLEELSARDLGADMSPAVSKRLNQYRTDFHRKDITFPEIWTLYPNGSPRTLQVLMRGIRLDDGRMALYCEGTVDHDLQPEALRSAEALLHTPVMISMFDRSGHPLYRNPASRATCIGPETNFFAHFVDPSDASRLVAKVEQDMDTRIVARVTTAQGVRWHEITARACSDAATGGPAYLVSEVDVTELQETRRRAEFLATHDPLTGLPNRAYINDRLPELLEEARQIGGKVYLYLIDLDGFKSVNDTMGHAAGDELLQVVSNTIRDSVDGADFVARLGGDEFLLCVLDTETTQNPQALGDGLLAQFEAPKTIEGRPHCIRFSVGFSVFPDDGMTMDALIRRADLALYATKSGAKYACTAYHLSFER
ncbi:MAG: sensor domain-containing diguanylate cyclase [Roseibium sp.]|nr:sensor domain-containing diguanylate cyclase [Roseibium sp.]